MFPVFYSYTLKIGGDFDLTFECGCTFDSLFTEVGPYQPCRAHALTVSRLKQPQPFEEDEFVFRKIVAVQVELFVNWRRWVDPWTAEPSKMGF